MEMNVTLKVKLKLAVISCHSVKGEKGRLGERGAQGIPGGQVIHCGRVVTSMCNPYDIPNPP